MGTFHDDKGDLHGITVVVETTGTEIYIGRCDIDNPGEIVLLDADVFDHGNDEQKKAEYLQKALKVGFWKKHTRIGLPKVTVRSVTRLGSLG